MILIPIGWLVTGFLGGWILAWKGYEPKLGVALGLLGIFGLTLALILPRTRAGYEFLELEKQIAKGPKRANCPNCGQQIAFGSAECPHCQYVITLSAKSKRRT